MQKKSFFLPILVVALIIGVAATLRGQNRISPPSDPDHAKHSLAVNLLRAINTAEYDYHSKHGSFASKETLLASEEFKGRGLSWAAKNDPQFANAQISSGPEVLPGWALRLNLTADAKGYDVLLQDTTDKSCGYAAYTDERGIIWQSKTIDCKI